MEGVLLTGLSKLQSLGVPLPGQISGMDALILDCFRKDIRLFQHVLPRRAHRLSFSGFRWEAFLFRMVERIKRNGTDPVQMLKHICALGCWRYRL